MVRRHPRLGRDVRKQPTLIHKCAPHASPRRFVIEKLNHDTLAMARVFQQTVRALKKVEPKQPLTPELEGEAYEIAHSRMVEFKESEEGVIWFRDAILRELNKAGKEPDFRIANEELLFNTLVNS